MVLDSAIEHADDGHEDFLGFHQEAGHRTAANISSDSPIALWDQVEGASCPLDINPAFRPIANGPFNANHP